MICPDCTREITTMSCVCGYQPNESNKPHLWVIQHCTRPGCTTAIRSRNGLPESELVCKWYRAKEEQGCAFATYDWHRPHEPAA